VKEPLIVEFVKKSPGKSTTGEIVSTPFYEVRYDFVLQDQAAGTPVLSASGPTGKANGERRGKPS